MLLKEFLKNFKLCKDWAVNNITTSQMLMRQNNFRGHV